MPITLPQGSAPKNYIEATAVTFKAKLWVYNFFDGETHDVKSIKWIIVGQGFQMLTTTVATKTKSVEYRSNELGWEWMKGEITMKVFTRDKTGNSVKVYGKKTYKQWKDNWMKLSKIVYVLSEDKNTLYKIIFSGRAFVQINKLIQPDSPNFITEFSVSETTEETDNGDFFSPILIKTKGIDPADESIIIEKIKYIDAILNKKEIPSLPHEEATEVFEDLPEPTKTPDPLKDMPF